MVIQYWLQGPQKLKNVIVGMTKQKQQVKNVLGVLGLVILQYSKSILHVQPWSLYHKPSA